MLIEFKIFNYRSICEEQVVSLVPDSGKKDHLENIIQVNKTQVLNSLAFYGPNSSGKSNILKSFSILDKLLYLSAQSTSTTKLPYDPFLLREGYNLKPTKFEITFITNDTRYRYGIEFNRTEIVEEWLYRKRIGREVNLFNRFKDTIDVSSGFEGSKNLIDTAVEATRDNALFLSFCDMLNVKEAKIIFEWFNNFNQIDGLNTKKESFSTFSLFENDEYRKLIKEYLSALDLGFEDILVEKKEFNPTDLPEHIDNELRETLQKELSGKIGVKVDTIHPIYDKFGKKSEDKIVWPMQERESQGTQKAFELSGPINMTLLNGGVLMIDEIEAKMHPIITLNTIDMFLSKKTNPKNAQLIFATHDTNLLSYANLRRDQINFVEKNRWEGTEIFSLSDLKYFNDKSERQDTDKETRYLEGRYGAIPFLNNRFFDNLTNFHGKKRKGQI